MLLVALLWLALSASAQSVRVTDDAGRTVELPAPATRIVSLAPHLTELLFAAGAGDAVVGVDEYSDYPAAAKALPRIGRHSSLDLEAIVALRPDLVLAWASGNRMPQLDRLLALGVPVYFNEIRQIEDIAASIETLGRLSATSAQAQAAADDLRRRVAALQREPPSRPLRVFYQIWDQPLMTINDVHLISRAIEICGGTNVFAHLSQLAPSISREAVLKADPQVIVASRIDGTAPQWLGTWQRWPELSAVAANAVHDLPGDLLDRPSPRFVDGVEALCAVLDAARDRIDQSSPSGRETRVRR